MYYTSNSHTEPQMGALSVWNL